jgi:hypothetical protein
MTRLRDSARTQWLSLYRRHLRHWYLPPIPAQRRFQVPIPANTGRRKTRLVRDEDPPEDLVMVVRAAGFDIDGALADVVRDARYSGESGALERGGGDREVLFGVSAFAVGRETPVAKVLEKFSASPHDLAVTVGQLRSAVSRRGPGALGRGRRTCFKGWTVEDGRPTAAQPCLRWSRAIAGGKLTIGIGVHGV